MPGPNESMRLERIPAPVLEPGAALLDVVFSEVCGTDVHIHHGRLAGVPPSNTRASTALSPTAMVFRSSVARKDAAPAASGNIAQSKSSSAPARKAVLAQTPTWE